MDYNPHVHRYGFHFRFLLTCTAITVIIAGFSPRAHGQVPSSNYTNVGIYETNPIHSLGSVAPGPENRSYGFGGLNDNPAYKTQGTQLQSAGSSYGIGGLNETIGAKTVGTTLTVKNCEFFTGYHHFGDSGGDIDKIQLFLQDRGYYTGKINGIYGLATFRAVKAFQSDLNQKILDPWGIQKEKPTGFWYKSTRYAANKAIGCPEPAVYLERVNKLLSY